MTAAELTSESFNQVTPNGGMKLVIYTGTAAANGDYLTAKEFTIVQGCMGMSTTGVPLTATITGTSNVITLVNGGALIWNIFIWGK